MSTAEGYSGAYRQNSRDPPHASTSRDDRAAAQSLKFNLSPSQTISRDRYHHPRYMNDAQMKSTVFDDTLTSRIEGENDASSDDNLDEHQKRVSPNDFQSATKIPGFFSNTKIQLEDSLAARVITESRNVPQIAFKPNQVPNIVERALLQSPKRANISGRFQQNDFKQSQGLAGNNVTFGACTEKISMDTASLGLHIYKEPVNYLNFQKEAEDLDQMDKNEDEDEPRYEIQEESNILDETVKPPRNSDDSNFTEDYSIEHQQPVVHHASNDQGLNITSPIDINEPDYDDEILKNMTYKTLMEEEFDKDSKLDPDFLNTQRNTADGLKHYLDVTNGAGKSENSSEFLENLFLHMSLDEWEKSGDWLVEQIAESMRLIKDARQKKRGLVKEQEAKIATREEAIRRKRDAIDQELGQMKEKGQNVVRRKNV